VVFKAHEQLLKNEASLVKKREEELATAIVLMQIDKAKPVSILPLF